MSAAHSDSQVIVMDLHEREGSSVSAYLWMKENTTKCCKESADGQRILSVWPQNVQGELF